MPGPATTALTEFLLPLAVIVSAASATSTAAFVWKLYNMSKLHDRALFGDEELEGHDGLVDAVNRNTVAVNENSQRVQRHRQALREADGVDGPLPQDGEK